MYDYPARVERLEPTGDRRILAISDIHGNLVYLKALLDRAGFCAGDELVIAGDFLEKGPESLATLRYIMDLSRGGNVHTLCGNCDDWYHIYSGDAMDDHLLYYLRRKKRGLLWDMCAEMGRDPLTMDTFTPYKAALREAFPEEWRFLSQLPHAIETESLIFAHAAVDPDKPLSRHTAGELMRRDRFLDSRPRFDRWVVVGHCPVMLYIEDRVCANPIIDREARVISLDGGCVLKDDGQLNALVIPHEGSEDFSFISYDHFPLRRVLADQRESRRSYYIRWGDSEVQVLDRGPEFSRCRHVRTGYEMDILTKYLFTDEEYTDCNDCTDYVLPLRAGDTVAVVEETSRGYFVKHGGCSGWFFGQLE